jgi:hypothetical protein
MNQARTFKMLALSVMALLALLSFNAVAAHAETEFKINGSPLKADETLSGETGGWLFSIVGNDVIMHCNQRLWVGFVVLFIPPSKVDDLYKYEGCSVLIKAEKVPSCEVKEFSLDAEASFFLHKGATYMLVGPKKETEELGTINFGEKCPLGSKKTVTGSYVMECVVTSCETEAVAHAFAPASPKLFSDTLKIGGETTEVEGSETIVLGGTNKGQKWSVTG